MSKRSFTTFEEMAVKYRQVLFEALSPTSHGKWTGKRANALVKAMERVSKQTFMTFNVMLKENKPAQIAMFVPAVEHSMVVIKLVQVNVTSRQPPMSATGLRVLKLYPHAVERLYKRMRTVDVKVLQDELRTSLLLALPLAYTAELLGLKQMPLPTRFGAFLCDVEGKSLVARTWVRDNDEERGVTYNMSKRLEEVVLALRAGANAVERDLSLETLRLAAIGELHSLEPIGQLFKLLLEPHAWMKSPYVQKDDHVGAMWDAARAQAEEP